MNLVGNVAFHPKRKRAQKGLIIDPARIYLNRSR